jgi:hypothetical protein
VFSFVEQELFLERDNHFGGFSILEKAVERLFEIRGCMLVDLFLLKSPHFSILIFFIVVFYSAMIGGLLIGKEIFSDHY